MAGSNALQALTAAGFAGNKSLAANGYYKLPGGFVIQWGSASIAGTSQSTITFPTAFPTSCDSVTVSWNDAPTGSGVPAASAGAGSITASNFVLASGSSATHTIGWIAFGH